MTTCNPSLSIVAPRSGYIVPAAYADWVAQRLGYHGIVFEHIEQAQSQRALETFRATHVTYSDKPFESHTTAAIEGSWLAELHDVPAGSLFVPIAQPKARLLMSLLEPQAPDSYAAWGLFNNAFEVKEYMEDYVAEDVARDMLAHDPAHAAAFRQKLAEDPAFAKDPAARLRFFFGPALVAG